MQFWCHERNKDPSTSCVRLLFERRQCDFPLVTTNLLRLAPQTITIEPISPNILKITVTPNAVSTGVTLYKVFGGKDTCEITASSSPLTCSLADLSAATEYAVNAKACSSTSHCSEAITKKTWTPPNGQFVILRTA